MAKGEKKAVLYRAAKFPIYPTVAQVATLVRISSILQETWNWALTEIMLAFTSYRLSKNEVQQAVATCFGEKVEPTRKIPTLFDLINALTQKRTDEQFGSIPRNWQEETLDRLNGSVSSFFTLAKNGDRDARPPRKREEHFFQVIPGRSGFSVKGGFIEFAPNIFGKGNLRFPIPKHQQDLIAAGTAKKFVIARDVADLSKKSGWSISVVYEIIQPETTLQQENKTVYLALRASSVGAITGEEVKLVLPFWRPDKHWKGKVEEIETRIKKSNLVKGGRAWKRLMDARKKVFDLMRKQQRQNHREMVTRLLHIGNHFVVTDYIVRSKKGKLADGHDSDRSGATGLNWSAQNTGSFLDFLMHLEEKVKEVGGSVTKHRLITSPPRGIGIGHDNKVAMAQHLRREVLGV